MAVAQDLIAVAEAIVRESASFDFHRKVEMVAAALQAEREACAGYHDNLVAEHVEFAETSKGAASKHHATMARRHAHYAAAIRKRGEG